MGIDRSVVAMVDATDDHIRPTRTDLRECQLHAVDGCTVAGPDLNTLTLFAHLEAEGDGGREGAGIAAAGIVRGTDDNVTHIRQHLGKAPDALRQITVIVGNEQ